MNLSVFELILILVVEDEAVLVEEAHDGRLPARTAQEVDDYIEEPVLEPETKALRFLTPAVW